MGRVAGRSPDGWGSRPPLKYVRAKRQSDVVDHAIHVLASLPVPEPQDPESLTFENGVPDGVMGFLQPFAMLRTVEFNDDAAAEADKIQKVPPEGRLSAEVKSFRPHDLEALP